MRKAMVRGKGGSEISGVQGFVVMVVAKSSDVVQLQALQAISMALWQEIIEPVINARYWWHSARRDERWNGTRSLGPPFTWTALRWMVSGLCFSQNFFICPCLHLAGVFIVQSPSSASGTYGWEDERSGFGSVWCEISSSDHAQMYDDARCTTHPPLQPHNGQDKVYPVYILRRFLVVFVCVFSL